METIFEKKFKNLLAFTCLLGSISEDYNDMKIQKIDYDYVIEKYIIYISQESKISIEEKEKILLFATTVKKLSKPDTLISKWEEIFGDKSFFNISSEPNYSRGLHPVLKTNLFDRYMDIHFKKSKKYKIWKILEK